MSEELSLALAALIAWGEADPRRYWDLGDSRTPAGQHVYHCSLRFGGPWRNDTINKELHKAINQALSEFEAAEAYWKEHGAVL